MPSQLKSRWPQVSSQVHQSVRVGTEKAADKMKSEMIGEMNKPKSGRVYGAHQASAPGETPATDSGETEGSIEVVPEGDSGFAVVVGGAISYLETGSRRAAARPLLLPVATRMKEETAEIIAKEVRSSIK
jgi:hypothetical protein